MRISFLCITCCIAICLSARGQYDMQTSILTENGIITVSKTTDGKDMVIISTKSWNEMVAGTKYEAYHLPGFAGRKLCIEIADKKHGFCKRGIGFGCGIYDCPYVPDTLPNKVNAENRLCAVIVKKIKGAVKIIFLDHVDWQSLQNIRAYDN